MNERVPAPDEQNTREPEDSILRKFIRQHATPKAWWKPAACWLQECKFEGTADCISSFRELFTLERLSQTVEQQAKFHAGLNR